MNSADIARELRASRPAASDALRERVRTIATAEPPARQAVGARLAVLRPRGRRSLLVLLPAAAMSVALAAGIVQLARPDAPTSELVAAAPEPGATAPDASRSKAQESYGAGTAGVGADSALPTPAPDRAQRTSVALALEVDDAVALSTATQRAISTTRALGGYLVTVQYGTSTGGSASLVAKVPSDRVQDAIARLSALGRITSQNVHVDDLQATLDEVDRRIALLRKRIAAITDQLADRGLSGGDRARLEATRASLRDQLAGDRRSGQAIRGDAAFATFEVGIATRATEQAVPAVPSRLDRALDDMAGILAIEGIVLLYALVVLVPLALALGLVWLAGRALGRRGRERLLEAS